MRRDGGDGEIKVGKIREDSKQKHEGITQKREKGCQMLY